MKHCNTLLLSDVVMQAHLRMIRDGDHVLDTVRRAAMEFARLKPNDSDWEMFDDIIEIAINLDNEPGNFDVKEMIVRYGYGDW